jgi:leader peptidase (prepilin peptidase)/N-methyltransferase
MMSFAETAAAFPWFFPMVAFFFGACIGSFLNVCIYRIPAGKSIVHPGSHCACGKPVAWHDNVPILSWIFLRGKARCCGRAFSIRYPAIELLTALLFLACWLAFPGAPGKAVCGWVLVSALIAGSFIDLDHMIIPDVFTIGLGICGVLLSFAVPSLHDQHSGLFIVDSMRSGMISILGLIAGSGFVLWFVLVMEAILKKEAMGFGDVKLVGAICAFTGWQGTFTALGGGSAVGLVWFAIAMLRRKLTGEKSNAGLKAETPDGQPADIGMSVHVPFGPMIAIAGALHFLWLHRWVDDLFAQARMIFLFQP